MLQIPLLHACDNSSFIVSVETPGVEDSIVGGAIDSVALRQRFTQLIDTQIYTSMSHAVFDCVSTVNDVCTCLINHLFVCVWAFTQANSYSTGFSLVARHGKYPIHWCSDLHIDVARSIWLRIYYQWRVCILNQSMYECTDVWMYMCIWIYECRDALMFTCMSVWLLGCMNV